MKVDSRPFEHGSLFRLTFVYALVSIQVNSYYLLFVGDEIIPSYIYLGMISEAILRIPINQPGFNGMSLVGFDQCKNIISIIINYYLYIYTSNVNSAKNVTVFVVLFHKPFYRYTLW